MLYFCQKKPRTAVNSAPYLHIKIQKSEVCDARTFHKSQESLDKEMSGI